MRLIIAGVAVVLCTTTALAQEPSRWTLSAGPEWGLVAPHTHLWGMRLRAEYDLTKPNSVFGLRLEGGARWSPTQGYFSSDNVATWSGIEQRSDLMLGFSGSLAPFPRARIAPYVTMGIFARQLWIHGASEVSFQPGSFAQSPPDSTRSSGDIIASLGVGLRARLAGRSFQLELRRLYNHNGLTFGTRLPF